MFIRELIFIFRTKKLRFAKVLKNIKSKFKDTIKQASKYIHFRTSLNICKITKKVATSSDFLTLSGEGTQSSS